MIKMKLYILIQFKNSLLPRMFFQVSKLYWKFKVVLLYLTIIIYLLSYYYVLLFKYYFIIKKNIAYIFTSQITFKILLFISLFYLNFQKKLHFLLWLEMNMKLEHHKLPKTSGYDKPLVLHMLVHATFSYKLKNIHFLWM